MDRSFNESRSTEAIDVDYAWCGRYLYDIQKDWGSISTHKKLSGRHVIILLSLFCYWFYDGFLGPGTGSF